MTVSVVFSKWIADCLPSLLVHSRSTTRSPSQNAKTNMPHLPTEDIISNLRCLVGCWFQKKIARFFELTGGGWREKTFRRWHHGIQAGCLKFLEPSMTTVRGFRGRIVKSREDGKFEVWMWTNPMIQWSMWSSSLSAQRVTREVWFKRSLLISTDPYWGFLLVHWLPPFLAGVP